MAKSILSSTVASFVENAEKSNVLTMDFENIRSSLQKALSDAFEDYRKILTIILQDGDKNNQWATVAQTLGQMHEQNTKKFIRAKTPDNRGLKRLINSKDLSIKIFANDAERTEHLAIVQNLINPFMDLSIEQKNAKENYKRRNTKSFWEKYEEVCVKMQKFGEKANHAGESLSFSDDLAELLEFIRKQISLDRNSGN